jgi:hypothetical protein
VTDFRLSADNAASYLTDRGLGFEAAPRCRELGGGVSNTVVLVESRSRRLVLKQALPQLRVSEEWFADRSRILRERDGLVAARDLLPADWVPKILWSDDENYLYALEALPEGSESWKERLLRGSIEPELARRAGIALGLTVRKSWRSSTLESIFGDQTAFRQLRTDPYYRTVARRHADLAPSIEAWIAQTQSKRLALTHGDWSPKNMLVAGDRMVFIDYECVHFGDPSYDAAFALNHLVLKSFHRPVHRLEYLNLARIVWTWTLAALPAEALADFETSTVRHLPLLMLARIDGKSPVEYLTAESVRETVRSIARSWILDPPAGVEQILSRLEG